MVRATELDKPSNNSGYLAVIKPRSSFEGSETTDTGGDVFKISFTKGKVVELIAVITGIRAHTQTTYTEAATLAGIANEEFFYDATNEELYFKDTDITVQTLFTFGATYEIYVATEGNHFNRIPTDNTTEFVYFEPYIVAEPNLKQTVEDSLFGFVPTSSSNIVLNNGTHFWEDHISSSSFNSVAIELYHWIDSLALANLKKIISGVCKNISANDSAININVIDRIDKLEQTRITDFYDSTFTALDEAFDQKPIRDVWGVVDGFVAVNVDYKEDAPTTSDNRDWAVIRKPADTNDLATISRTVQAGSTTTTTILDDATGLIVGDAIRINKATDEYVFVKTVVYGTKTITHDTLVSGAAVASDTVDKGFVSQIQIVQDGVRYFPRYIRDYTISTDVKAAGLASGFVFNSSMEASLGMSTLKPSDEVICRVYGPAEFPTIGGSPYGAVDVNTGNLTNPLPIVYSFLKELVPESEINTTDLIANVNDALHKQGFAYPFDSTSDFLTYKEIIVRILQSAMIRLYVDNEGLWTISAIGPLGVADETLDDGDIAPLGSFNYRFSYEDVYSKVLVNYNIGERAYAFEPGATPRIHRVNTTESKKAVALHRVDKILVLNTNLFQLAGADTISDRYSFALEDRKGILSIGAKNKVFDSDIDDVVTVQRTKMPGFSFNKDTERSKSFTIESKQRSLKSVNIEINDQKGIEDNSGSW